MTDLDILWKRLRSFGAEGKCRSDQWLARIRLLPCSVCGSPSPNEPHHWAAAYQSLKCSDILTIPVCRKCHTEIHATENTPQTRLMLFEAWTRLAHGYIYEEMKSDKLIPIVGKTDDQLRGYKP